MRLHIVFHEEKLDLPVCLRQEDMRMCVDFGHYQVIHISDPIPEYQGSYIITPRIASQTLDTDNKKLTDDIKVLAIPRVDVSNLAGGLTVTIG